ncbi:MAG: serine hydrolase domain-containing protein, partial [Balneolaceae bacterium]|nr:serine hydrolase domain-containing protein [Balneolaceae bacterium]
MMKKGPLKGLLCLNCLLLLLSACGSVSNPDAAVDRLQLKMGMSEEWVGQTGSVLARYPNRTQLSIALVEHDEVLFYGASRQNDTLRTVKNATAVFEIGSLSKVFTSTLLAQLASQSKLDLDDSIQACLEFPLHNGIEITFRQLANHTSGLPRIPSGLILESLFHMDNPYRDYNEEKLRSYLTEKMELKSEPGTTYRYSNIGAGLLGFVLARATGMTYEKLLQDRIFKPLGMPNSTTTRANIEGKLVPGLTKRGHPAENWDLGALPGAGAVLSTAEDLSRFAMANFDPAH